MSQGLLIYKESIMAARPMSIQHANNNAGVDTNGEVISVNRGRGQYVAIVNTGATNSLEISFNEGQDYFAIPPGGFLELDALFNSIRVRSDAATTTYNALIGRG